MAEKTVKALPLVPAQYDSVNESINRRTIEQALQDLYSEVGHVKDMQESGISKAVKRHIFLLMGASHCCFNGGSISMMLTALAGIKLPDNQRIYFGNDNDMEIYHDSANSIIKETGTGGLRLQTGNSISFRNGGGGDVFFQSSLAGATNLYHNKVQKLATTTSGVEIDGVANIQSSDPNLYLTDTDGTNQIGFLKENAGVFNIIARNNTSNGTIKFAGYNGTTTTEFGRFDSSGRLGIGQVPTNYALEVADSSNIMLKLASTTATNNVRMVFAPNNNEKWNVGVQYSNDNFTFYDITNGATPFRIEQGAGENTLMVDVNSRVGMGLNNPATKLHIQDATNPVLRVEDSTNNVKTDIGATDTQGYIGTNTANPFMLRYQNVDSYRFDNFKQMYHGNTTNADRLMTGGNLLPYQYLDTRDYMRRCGHHASSDFVVFLHANDHEIVPYLDNTNIYLNGNLIHSNVSAFTQVVIPNASLSIYDIISADKPISVSQNQPRQYASPISFGGEVLGSFATRYYPQDFLLYSPYSKVDYEVYASGGASTVDISGTPVATGTIDYKSGATVSVAGSGTNYYVIKATGHIVGMKRGTGGDNILLPPIGQEVISNAQATSVLKINDGSNSSSTTTTTNGGGYYYRENRGDRDLGIGAFGTADGAGGDAEFGIPLEFLSDYYIYNETTITNFRLVSYKSNQIQVLDKNGNRLYQYDHTNATKEVVRFQEEGTASGSGPDLSTNGPFRFIGTSPFHLVCQSTQDLECVLLGALQDEIGEEQYFNGGTITNDLNIKDNKRIYLGDSSDLQLYHDGSVSRIVDAGTGDLKIQGTHIQIRNSNDTSMYARFTDGGSAELNYGGSKKFETLTNGVQISGDTLVLTTSKTPSSATDTGTTGQIAWDSNYIYVCVATNTWKRVAISTW